MRKDSAAYIKQSYDALKVEKTLLREKPPLYRERDGGEIIRWRQINETYISLYY